MTRFHGDAGDLVKRLRSIGADIVSDDKDRRKAADLIETLTAVITMLESEAKFAERVVETLRTYIKQQSSCNRPLHLGDLIEALDAYAEAEP